MIQRNRCKQKRPRLRREKRRTGPRTRVERVETRRNGSERSERRVSRPSTALPAPFGRRAAALGRRNRCEALAKAHSRLQRGARGRARGRERLAGGVVGTGRGRRTGRGARTRAWPSTRSAGDQRHGRRGQRRNGSTATAKKTCERCCRPRAMKRQAH